jgi:Integrase core domain
VVSAFDVHTCRVGGGRGRHPRLHDIVPGIDVAPGGPEDSTSQLPPLRKHHRFPDLTLECRQQDGRHERMHRTLKAETTRPPCANLRAQQQKFNHFRDEFNHERPHEALDMRTPAACYDPSSRKMPTTLPPLEDPDRFEVHYVSANGGIRWNHRWVNVSHVCVGEYVGLEEIDDGVWNVYFGPLKLGRLLERHMRIEDAYGRLKRHR